MALYHKATITPSKSDLIAEWAPSQPWFPRGTSTEVVGAFRFDDPDGQVGIETHMVMAGDTLLQVPITYRNEPLADAEDAFVGTTEHSALGTRWVYDGLAEDIYLAMLAGAAMTGQGEALGMVVYDGRWHIAPANVRLLGGGWNQDRVAVDEFTIEAETESSTTFGNDGFTLTFHRHPVAAERPPLGLSATLDAAPDPVLLAQVTPR